MIEPGQEVFCQTARPTGIPGLRAGMVGVVLRSEATWLRASLDNGLIETFQKGEWWLLPEGTREARRAFLTACKYAGLDTLDPSPTTAIRRIICAYSPSLKRTPFEELTVKDWQQLEVAVSPKKEGLRLRLKVERRPS
jgi:hypothetical protein